MTSSRFQCRITLLPIYVQNYESCDESINIEPLKYFESLSVGESMAGMMRRFWLVAKGHFKNVCV
jgi:hypothetical protein